MLHSLTDALEASLVASNWVPFELGVALGRKGSRLLPLYLNAIPQEVHKELPFHRNRIGFAVQEHSVPEIAEQIATTVEAHQDHAESAQQAS